MNYLTPDQVLFLHTRSVEETRDSPYGCDVNLLESAVARPQATFGVAESGPAIAEITKWFREHSTANTELQ